MPYFIEDIAFLIPVPCCKTLPLIAINFTVQTKISVLGSNHMYTLGPLKITMWHKSPKQSVKSPVPFLLSSS